jgi:phosphoribosylanthranilate isomerase
VTQVKICGVNDALAFDAAVAEGADFIGFVFFARSPRYVTPAQAAALSARHRGGPKRVALLVEPSDDLVAEAVAALRPDVLQLYTNPARVAELRARFGVPVWRGVGVSAAADLPTGTDGADALLIETKAPADATRPGGNAVAFDWSILAGWKPGFDWMLAGGLSPDNVAEAIRGTGAPGVDVSSGVESAPGVKDAALIRAFVAAVRAAAT